MLPAEQFPPAHAYFAWGCFRYFCSRRFDDGFRGHKALIRLLAKRRPKWMAGIDADDAEFAREELQLLQRECEAPVIGMAVDVGIELGREEIAVDHVALELRHVDAVGGETA